MLEDDIEDDVDDNEHIDFKPFGISPASEPQGKPPGPVPVLPWSRQRAQRAEDAGRRHRG
jgi:hypothetical protein